MLRLLAFFCAFLFVSCPVMAASASPLPALSKDKKDDGAKPPAAVSHLEKEAGSKDTAPKDAAAAETSTVAEDDPYTIRGIKVDVVADTSMKARDKAFSEGQRKAFESVARSLTSDETYSATTVDDAKIGKLVKSFEVESERASGTRYIATLTYHFKPQQTSALLGKSGADISDDPYNKPKKGPIAETPTPAPPTRTLILPILRTANRSILWEEKTDWHRAWDNVLSDHPAPDLVVPEGNLEDVGSIASAEALAGLTVPLMRIMNRYQAKGIIIAVLMAGSDTPQTNQNLSIQVARFDDKAKLLGTTTLPLYAQPARKEMEWLQGGVQASIATWRDLTAKEAAAATPNNGIAQPAPMNAQALRLMLNIPFANMEEWSAKRESLQQVPGVLGLEVVRMNRFRAVVQLDFSGAQMQLEQALADKNMRMTPTSPADGSYTLSAFSQQQPLNPGQAVQPVFTTVYPQAPQPGPYAAPYPAPQQMPAQVMPTQAVPQQAPATQIPNEAPSPEDGQESNSPNLD